MKCATTKIVADNKQGFIVINESDVKEGDKVFKEAAKPKGKSKAKADTKSDDEATEKAE